MKYIAIVDLPDDAPEYGEWHIDDEGSIRYLEDGNCWMHYKDIDVDGIRLVPLPKKIDLNEDRHSKTGHIISRAWYRRHQGYNDCIDEIMGEAEQECPCEFESNEICSHCPVVWGETE